jgi:small conductance mechanosensitive channel
VSYGVSTDTVLEIMEKAAEQPAVLADPAAVFAVKEYNQQSITYGMMLWCNADDYWALKFAVNRELSRLAKEAGITFYDPRLSVRLEK